MNAEAAPQGAVATDHEDSADFELAGDGPLGADDIASIDDIEELEDIDDLEDVDGGDDEDGLDGDALGNDALHDDGLDDDGLDDDALDDDALHDGLDDDALDDDTHHGGADESLEVLAAAPAATEHKAGAPDASPEAETDDDELLTDEVEASLDVILAERLRGGDTEVDEEVESDDEEDDAPNQLATVIPVRRPEEFLCQSCFLLKPPGQLADRDHQLCRDCA